MFTLSRQLRHGTCLALLTLTLPIVAQEGTASRGTASKGTASSGTASADTRTQSAATAPQGQAEAAQPATTRTQAGPVLRQVNPENLEGDAPTERFGDIEARPPAPLGGVYHVPVDFLIDKPVVNQAGLPIGEVEEVVVNTAGTQGGLVVSTGDRVGIGGSWVLAPAEEIELVGESLVWNTSSSLEELRYSQQFVPEDFETVEDNYETLGEAVNAALAAQ